MLLNRPADASGQTFWANVLANGLSDSALVAALAGSQEYAGKPGASSAGAWNCWHFFHQPRSPILQ